MSIIQSEIKNRKHICEQKVPEEYSVKFIKLILIFMSITKEKYKLIEMETNTYYLELMFNLLISFSYRN